MVATKKILIICIVVPLLIAAFSMPGVDAEDKVMVKRLAIPPALKPVISKILPLLEKIRGALQSITKFLG